MTKQIQRTQKQQYYGCEDRKEFECLPSYLPNKLLYKKLSLIYYKVCVNSVKFCSQNDENITVS